jgi:hypothetical protein
LTIVILLKHRRRQRHEQAILLCPVEPVRRRRRVDERGQVVPIRRSEANSHEAQVDLDVPFPYWLALA